MARQRTPDQHFLSSRTGRRQFVAGGIGLGLAAGLERSAAAQPDAVGQIDPESATYPLVDEKATLRVLIPSSANVEDYETNDFTAWYEERTNVHVEWNVVSDGDQDAAGLNVRLASGDYPDVIMGFGIAPSVQQLYGMEGVFLPLNELIETHGIETQRFFAQQPNVRPSITASDGNIYALPIFAGCYHCTYMHKLWIYRPWLETLGLEMPTTTDEFEQVLLAFKEGDPNGNGEADELPLMSAVTGAHPLDAYFMNSFLYNPATDSLGTRLAVHDGVVQPVYTQPEWREGAKYLARLFDQGLIDPESFTQDLDQIRNKLANEPDVIAGAFTALSPSSVLPVVQGEYGRWTDYVAVPPLVGPEGVQYAAYDPYQALRPGEFIITDNCEDPELAFRWVDGLYDLEASISSTDGIRDEHWRWAEDGEIGNNGEPAIWSRLVSFGGLVNYYWGQNNPYYRPEPVHSGQVMDPEIADRSLETILYTETKEKYVPYGQPGEWTLPPLFFSADDAGSVAELDALLKNYVDETLAQVVTGQIDAEAEWDSYLANLENIGLSRYIDIHQRAYDNWASANA